MPLSPISLTDLDNDPNTGGNPGGGGGGVGGGGGYPPPPSGSSNAMTRRWVDIKWNYTEPQPQGACTGFEVAIFAGTDPDTGTLACPFLDVDDPAARRWMYLLELRTKIDLRAAVRACYGNFRSAWANAAATATFIPDVLPSQNTASGSEPSRTGR